MYDKNYKNYVYACSKCFNKIENCVCSFLPETLIQVDKNIWPTIKTLNNKWYFTEQCCEGHVGSNEKIYIFFKRIQKFSKPLPKGFIFEKDLIWADFSGGNEQTRKRKKRKLLNDLYIWSCSLESHKPEGCRL